MSAKTRRKVTASVTGAVVLYSGFKVFYATLTKHNVSLLYLSVLVAGLVFICVLVYLIGFYAGEDKTIHELAPYHIAIEEDQRAIEKDHSEIKYQMNVLDERIDQMLGVKKAKVIHYPFWKKNDELSD